MNAAPVFTNGRRGPTTALMVAILALVLALAGTSYAALNVSHHRAGTAQPRDPSVTAAKTQVGGGTSIVYTRGNPATIPAHSTGNAYVRCPNGTYPVGGGVGVSNLHVVVYASVPYNTVTKYHGAANAWIAFAANTDASAPHNFSTYAVCASAAQVHATY